MSFSDRIQKTFFYTYGGKFAIRVPKGTPGSVTRINKEGNEVTEIFHDDFTGTLTGINVSNHTEYGKSWNFNFVGTDGLEYIMKLSYSNSFATSLLKMLPNIDVSKPFKMITSTKVVEGKNQSSLFVEQEESFVKHAFNRENPNGMPDLEKIVVKGKETWDDTKRLEFFEELVAKDIVPKLPKASDVEVDNAPTRVPYEEKFVAVDEDTSDVVNDDDSDVNPEDLPF